MKPILSHPMRLSDLPRRKPVAFRLIPDEGGLESLSDRLGVDALRKVRFEGAIHPQGKSDWVLKATLGATVVQPCRVTTDPVVTRIDEEVARTYAADYVEPAGDDVEMPEDDGLEPLPATLDVGAVLEEALALAIPAFPRAPAADEIDVAAVPPGADPIDDDTVKPFAGLAALRDRMKGGDD
ncbi:DUF177 domain-containing protein [Jannaschia sp. LMIT008]|uniref:YceD family protein n=1 Tax=Jannaschia maritima TaxID=3032585 RepID=UPI0028116E3C|nr:DUF177 domain-containing protein [Jannaschia sp. LMIT008]